MNEILWMINLFVSFGLVLLFYKRFGKIGLFVWTAIATVVTNIQTVKIVQLINIETSLGTILYGTTFIVTDILQEKYGAAEAKNSIKIGFVSMIVMTLLMSMALLYIPSDNDFSSSSLNLIFNLNFRITIASLIAYISSQWVDHKIYKYLKIKNTKLWIRNNLSTIISQFIDTFIFIIISYVGLTTSSSIISISLSMYFFKLLIALCDTPFMYIAMKINPKEVVYE